MNILFIHQNFPGQYKHLAPALAAAGHTVKALAINRPAGKVAGIEVVAYRLHRQSSRHTQPWAQEFETKVIRGEACGRAMLKLKQNGYRPDVVLANPGWGEPLFVKDVWPDTKLLTYLEFFYAARGRDVDFDPEFARNSFEEDARVRVKNANLLLALEAMDWGISPTQWQRGTMPREFQSRITVAHDGIDTDIVAPDPAAAMLLRRGGRIVRAGDEVVTFVSRNLEPYRGYHTFMRALPEIQRRRPNAIALIVGGDGVSYGAEPKGGSHKEKFLAEVRSGLDMSRVVFLGRIPYADFLKVLQVSACHVYLTYPFVLSWSAIEALSAGCLVVGSATPPVQEVIEHGRNGLLVDFFDVRGLAASVSDVLAGATAMKPMREAARRDAVAHYDLKRVCLPRHLELVQGVAENLGISPCGRGSKPPISSF
jgi:glycosyltransferase involved in cell wall biosynthesis